MSENILSDEVAEEQFELLADYYDLDEPTDGDLKKAHTLIREKLLKAIRKGRIEIEENDKGLFVKQNLVRSYEKLESPIVYGELKGTAKIAMRQASENDQYGKIYALLGGITGTGAGQFRQLRGVDLAIAENLGALFLMV